MAAKAGYRLFTEAEKEEVWRMRRRGEFISVIAKKLGRYPSNVHEVLCAHGGIQPRPRQRNERQLGQEEREAISRGLSGGLGVRAIARSLERAPSTVSREIQRNGGPQNYRAVSAEARAHQAGRRPKGRKLHANKPLWEAVRSKLTENWSPQQIARWLRAGNPDDAGMQISHEAIYQTLYVQARGELKKELISHLRKRHAIRNPKPRKRTQPRARIADMVNISERPPEASDRAVPGHWEGDLLCGSKGTQIITLVERRSRYVILIEAKNQETRTVVDAMIEHIRRLPQGLLKTLTWDQGREMADHARFTVATDVKVYFCDPRSPWQRGSNENTNGLLRQYFPKGMDLSTVDQDRLDEVSRQLNTRPRETLGWKFPVEILNGTVAMTG
jgi:IS30 family transposase